jgi:hypothetical protein
MSTIDFDRDWFEREILRIGRLSEYCLGRFNDKLRFELEINGEKWEQDFEPVDCEEGSGLVSTHALKEAVRQKIEKFHALQVKLGS